VPFLIARALKSAGAAFSPRAFFDVFETLTNDLRGGIHDRATIAPETAFVRDRSRERGYDRR
jgi:hypothetical protein